MANTHRLTIAQQPSDANTDIINLTEQFDQLSPTTQQSLGVLLRSISNGKAQIDYDKNGKQFIDYKEKSKLYWDGSRANTTAEPKSDPDIQLKVDACLELIDYFKTEKPPSAILLDKTKISLSPGKDYRENHEFTKTGEVLGKGNCAGDIVVLKDKKTGTEHAQKTMMISVFRKEEIRCWVDMAETGYVPCLYYFSIVKNKVTIHMEALRNVKTLHSVIDDHMASFYEEEVNKSLVKPFSLFVLDGALEAVSELHRKGWLHKDLHAEQALVQKTDHNMLKVKILDFGLAGRLDTGFGIDYRGFQDDLANVVRLFTGLYMGNEFVNSYQLRNKWSEERSKIEASGGMSVEDKQELFCLVDAALAIVTPSEVEEYKHLVKQKLAKAMGDSETSSDIMKRVVALLFQEDFKSISHDAKDPDPLAVQSGAGVAMNVIDGARYSKAQSGISVDSKKTVMSVDEADVYSPGQDESDFYDLDHGSNHITDALLEKLRSTMSIAPASSVSSL